MYRILTISFLGLCIFSFLHAVKGNDCDHLGTIIYEDLGCKPITQTGKDCPIKYECDLEEKNNTCLFRGRDIPVNQKIPSDLLDGDCYSSVTCIGDLPSGENVSKIKGKPAEVGGRFIYAVTDCAEYFGIPPLSPGCHSKYVADKCCSTGVLCDKPESPVEKCVVSPDKTVLEGQKFNPPNTCLKCVCPKNFNGKFEESHCARVTCAAQISYQREIIDHCAPFYKAKETDPLCCPYTWICPKGNETISIVNSKADQTSDLRCRFGKTLLKLGEGFESSIIEWEWDSGRRDKKAKCECILPPLVTCILDE